MVLELFLWNTSKVSLSTVANLFNIYKKFIKVILRGDFFYSFQKTKCINYVVTSKVNIDFNPTTNIHSFSCIMFLSPHSAKLMGRCVLLELSDCLKKSLLKDAFMFTACLHSSPCVPVAIVPDWNIPRLRFKFIFRHRAQNLWVLHINQTYFCIFLIATKIKSYTK